VVRTAAAAPAASTAPPNTAEQQGDAVSSVQERKKVSFVSLGCPKNVVDGEWQGWWVKVTLVVPMPLAMHNSAWLGQAGSILMVSACSSLARCLHSMHIRNRIELPAAAAVEAEKGIAEHLPCVCAGEVLLGDLARAGFDITRDHEDADAIVVNTCAFVEVRAQLQQQQQQQEQQQQHQQQEQQQQQR
jgi:hypothetical protein